MKNIFYNLIALVVMLMVAQTTSAIPASAIETDFGAVSAQSISHRHTSSRLHEKFRSFGYLAERSTADDLYVQASLTGVRDRVSHHRHARLRWHEKFRSFRYLVEEKTGDDQVIQPPLTVVDDPLELGPATVVTEYGDDGFFERGEVDIPEPSLAALVALGLVGFGFASRKRNH